MSLKNIAKAFGLTVNEFAILMGYTRQALYQSFENKNKVNSTRMLSALNHLKFSSDSIYSQDLTEAKIQQNLRERGIKEIAEKCGIPFEEKNNE